MTPSTIYTYSDALIISTASSTEAERHVRYAPEVMTLNRPRRVLEAFGSPQNQYPIIHITGTKGKGPWAL